MIVLSLPILLILLLLFWIDAISDSFALPLLLLLLISVEHSPDDSNRGGAAKWAVSFGKLTAVLLELKLLPTPLLPGKLLLLLAGPNEEPEDRLLPLLVLLLITLT